MDHNAPITWIAVDHADPMPVSMDVFEDESRWWDRYGDTSNQRD